MNWIKKIFQHTPLMSILILFAYVAWFYLFELPSSRRGSDAMGSGMAQGFAVLFFYAFLFVYVLIMLISLVLYFKKTNAPVIRAILNFILLVPAFFLILAFVDIVDVYFKERREFIESYKKWLAIAKTKTYTHPSGRYSFQYTSHIKHKHGIRLTKLAKSSKSTVLFYIDHHFSINYFIGSVVLTVLAKKTSNIAHALSLTYNKVTKMKCLFVKTDKHSFDLIKSKNVEVYRISKNCGHPLMEHRKEADPNFLNIQYHDYWDPNIYFIYDKRYPGKILEVTTIIALFISGPVEKNLPEQDNTDWYQTFSIK